MFELAFPWAFIALPLPVLVSFLFPQAKTKLVTAVKIPFADTLFHFSNHKTRSFFNQSQDKLLFFIWCLVLLALAGPRWVGPIQPLEREGHNIMMALDLSGSMALNDMTLHGRPASRIVVVKQAAEKFVRERISDRIGLILFGTRAYLQTPLTYDHHAVLLRLEDASVGLAGQTTSIGDAIGLAVKHLQKVPSQGRVLIILTDGANNSGLLSPLKAAELAKLEQIKVYTIGLGAKEQSQGINALLMNPIAGADLDEEALQEVAKITEGRYFRATDTKSLNEIYHTINQLETLPQEQASIRPQLEYYPWPLALACLLLFYWFIARFKTSP